MDPKIYKHIQDLSIATMLYDNFCKRKECLMYIEWEWDYDNSPCKSCKKIGQTYQISKYPGDCLFKDEIERATVMARLQGMRRVE